MRLAFVDFTHWDYDGNTPYERALGGSQSALCYLTEQLARDGHELLVLNGTSRPSVVRGVEYRAVSQTRREWLANCKAIVVLNAAEPVAQLRQYAPPNARLVLWSQHAHDQPAVAALHKAEVRDAFDAFALVSQWQREHYLREFRLDAARTNVMRNAMAPAFQQIFTPDEDIAAAKQDPPLLAYTSTPFRGLDVLVRVFPQIRAAVREATLRVYSSMQVYQMRAEDDHARYADLYRACDETEGIKRVGSLAQPQLARELRRTAVLAYANHFPETSCIAAIEALAAGCLVVTSDLGALGETTCGCARLVLIESDPAGYAERFIAATVEALQQWTTARASLTAPLAQQVALMNEEYTWPIRARQWAAWLSSL